MLIWGMYEIKKLILGYRQGLCNYCNAPVLIWRRRYFRLGHLFFLPLLPLGWAECWICSQCENDPDVRYADNVRFLRGAAVFFAVTGLFLFIGSFFGAKGEDLRVLTYVGLGLLAAAAALVRYARPKPQPIPPKITRDTEHCLRCRGALQTEPHLHCPACNLRVYTES